MYSGGVSLRGGGGGVSTTAAENAELGGTPSGFCHATLILIELHWLPIAERVEFKTFLLVELTATTADIDTNL